MTIRFRVWDGEKMWYPEDNYRQDKDGDGGYFLKQDGVVYEGSEDDDFMIIGAGFPVCSFPCEETAIAMLSTGLKDKDGKEIWEGDVVGYNNHLSEHYHQLPVTFTDGRFRPITDVNEFGQPEWINIRIVGNIYETDLLQKAEEVASSEDSTV